MDSKSTWKDKRQNRFVGDHGPYMALVYAYCLFCCHAIPGDLQYLSSPGIYNRGKIESHNFRTTNINSFVLAFHQFSRINKPEILHVYINVQNVKRYLKNAARCNGCTVLSFLTCHSLFNSPIICRSAVITYDNIVLDQLQYSCPPI